MTFSGYLNLLSLSFLTGKMKKYTHTPRGVGGLKEIIHGEYMAHSKYLIDGSYYYCCWDQSQNRIPTVPVLQGLTIAGPTQGDRWAEVYPMGRDRWTKIVYSRGSDEMTGQWDDRQMERLMGKVDL